VAFKKGKLLENYNQKSTQLKQNQQYIHFLKNYRNFAFCSAAPPQFCTSCEVRGGAAWSAIY